MRVPLPLDAGMRMRGLRFRVAPGDIYRRLVAGHQPLVGIDERVGDGRHTPDVAHDAGDVAEGVRAQLQGSVLVVERVVSIPEEGLVGMHARTVDAEDGLGQEGGVQSVAFGDGLDHHFERHDVVSGAQGVVVLEINLVLAPGHLMVAGLDLKAHFLQRQAHVAPGVLPHVDGARSK